MSWDELNSVDVRSAESPLESARFGVTVTRITAGVRAPVASATRDFGDLISAAQADVVIARWPAVEPRFGSALAGSGRHVIPSDTLVYWEVETEHLRSRAIPARMWTGLVTELPRASGGDLPTSLDPRAAEVLDVVGSSFAAYPNHYLSNPLLSPDAAQVGYQDWAMRVFLDRPEDVIALLVDEALVGVATVAESGDRGHLEVLLAGLTPSAQGKGWYSSLFVGVARQAARRGIPRIVISTQSGNVRVQRAWTVLGLKPFGSIATAHAVSPQAWGRRLAAGP